MQRFLICLCVAAGARRSLAVEDFVGAELAGLERAVAEARGVYWSRRPGRATDPVTQNTVLVVSFNHAYVHFAENWACHARRLGLKYLAWPEEAEALHAFNRSLASREPGCTVYFSPALARSHPVGTRVQRHNGRGFNILAKLKFVTVLATLRRGVNAWFSDVDIAFLRDPWPGIRATSDGADYVFQSNLKSHRWISHEKSRFKGINTGFHWFRASEKVTAFVGGAVSEMFEPENERSEDQQVFNDYLKRRPITDAGPQPESSRFRIRVLDPPKYPIGRADEAFLKQHESVLIHANWMAGAKNKHAKLQKLGLWIADHGACWPFPYARYQMREL